MKVKPDPRLFWFLKEDILLDLSKPSIQDMYVQEILSHGGMDDVKNLLKMFGKETFQKIFSRVRYFLKKEVRMFWEEYFENH